MEALAKSAISYVIVKKQLGDMAAFFIMGLVIFENQAN
jgi:hypothetical protein